MSDVLTIVAIAVAPFLAVFAQKQIEIWRSTRDTKRWIFRTLMATRRATLSIDHVQALNLIDLEFSERNAKEKEVRRIWREYLNHLCSLPEDPEQQEKVRELWQTRCNDYLAELLVAMGVCVGYTFDKVYIQQGIYSPVGHAHDEMQMRLMRSLFLQLLQGERELPITASLHPADHEGEKFMKKYQKTIMQVLEGRSELCMRLSEKPSEKSGTEE